MNGDSHWERNTMKYKLLIHGLELEWRSVCSCLGMAGGLKE